MEVATRAFDSLAAGHGDKMEAIFKNVKVFKSKPLGRARQVLRLAALIHDIGHSCFSHAPEELVTKGLGHEAVTLSILREMELGENIDKIYGEGTAEQVAFLIEGSPNFPQLKLLGDLVSGDMDADRTDYLLRDSYYCGVEYGRFDYQRMISCLTLYEGEEGSLEIALNRDGIHTFEALIVSRYQMFTQVYYHRLRRIYDKYIGLYFEALGKEIPNTLKKILAENDTTMMARIIKDAKTGRGKRKKWAQRIYNRNHHRMIFETGYEADVEDIRTARTVIDDLNKKYPEHDFIFDHARGNIHSQYTRGSHEENPKKLMLVGQDNRSVAIGLVSQIIDKIPRQYECGRIFADVGKDDKSIRKRMERFAQKKYIHEGGKT